MLDEEKAILRKTRMAIDCKRKKPPNEPKPNKKPKKK